MGIGDSLLRPDVVSLKIYEEFRFSYHKFLVDKLKKMDFNLVIHIYIVMQKK